jgi:chemotaxis protein MotB
MPAQVESPGLGDDLTIDAIDPPAALALDYLAAVLNAEIAGNAQLAGASVEPLPDRLVLSLPSALLFADGAAELHGGAESALFVLGGALAAVRNRVDVVGHTDPSPAVAAALQAAGYTRPLGIYGRASGRFAELDPALPLAQRQHLAQRVDIVIREDGGHSE